jgi:hypothetical protein
MNRNSFRRLITEGDDSFFTTSTAKHLHRPASDLKTLDEYRDTFFEGRPPDGFVMQDVAAYRHLAKFHVSRETHTYLRKLLSLAKDNGVQVFWITTPVPRSALAALREAGYERDLAAYLAEFARRGELTVMQAGFLAYDDALFRDFIHPGPAVAIQFSCELGKLAPGLLARVSGGPRVRLVSETGFRSKALADQHEAREELTAMCKPASFSAAAAN